MSNESADVQVSGEDAPCVLDERSWKGYATLVAAADGTILRLHPALAAAWGDVAGDLPGRSLETLFPFRAIGETLRRAGQWRGLLAIPGRDTDPLTFQATFVAVTDAAGELERCVGVFERPETAPGLPESELGTAERAAPDVAPLGQWSFDPASERFFGCSRETLALLGLDADTEARPRLPELLAEIHPDDVIGIERAFARALVSRQPFRRDLRVPLADGGQRHLEMLGVASLVPDGRFGCLSGVLMDVTQRDLTGERIRLFESLADAATDAIVIARPEDAILLYANRAAHHLFGCDPERREMLGEDGKRFWPSEDLPILEALIPCALAGGWTGDVRQRRRDGSIFDANVTVYGLPVSEQGPPLLVAMIRDISERKRMETALKLTQFAIERSSDAVYLIDPDARFLYVNAAASAALGFTQEELLSMSIMDIDPDARPEELAGNFDDLRRHGRLTLERRHRRKDGSTLPVEILANYQCVEGKEYNYCFARDISERKQAELALRASRQRLGELIDAVPDALFALDAAGCVTVWNREIERMSGVPKERVMGQGDHAYARAFHGMVRPMLIDLVCCEREPDAAFRALYDDVRWEEDLIVAQVYLPRVYGGRGAYVWGKARPLRDSDGRIMGAIEIIRDITEQKEAEKALRLSEARFRSLVSNAPVIIFELDDTGLFRLIEGRGLEALGLRSGELVRSSVVDFLDDDVPVQRYLEQALGNEPVQFNARIGQCVFETFLNPVRDPGDGRVSVIGVAVDVTERTQREIELQQRTDELTRFTYTVSHDLKSPLVTIRTFLGFLEQDLAQANGERVEKDIGFIRNAAERMTRLLDELLELSRIGRIVNEPSEFTLQELAREALDLVAGRIVERGVEVRVSELPVLIRGDRPRLVEVLLNLLDNAVKFMGDQPRPRIRIEAEPYASEVEFIVSDNGRGIDPRHVHKIFGLFEKLDAGSEGTGIGLTLVQRIVEVHGGRIWAESEGVGKGAAFHFTLPGARPRVP